MKRVLVVVGVLFAVVALAQNVKAGRWDGSFVRKGTFTTTNADAGLSIDAGSYVKVVCDINAFVGVGKGKNTTCLDPNDGGIGNCDWIQYTLGEKFYSQMTAVQDRVAAWSDAGAANCVVHVSQN